VMTLIQCLAMGAALVAIVVGLADGYGALVTLKRAVISYLAFSIVGSLVGIVFRLGIEDDWIREAWHRHLEEQRKREEERRRERERRRRQKEQEQAAAQAAAGGGQKKAEHSGSHKSPGKERKPTPAGV